jgi:nucleoid DNA-binding protein
VLRGSIKEGKASYLEKTFFLFNRPLLAHGGVVLHRFGSLIAKHRCASSTRSPQTSDVQIKPREVLGEGGTRSERSRLD